MKILAICGSTRKQSSNLQLLHAIAELSTEYFQTEIYTGIDLLPHFNPDIELNGIPDEVLVFKQKIKESEGILICTPEYAMGVPGTLKNAIDWCVGSGEFMRKPTALITASSIGQKGHASLLETLHILEADLGSESELIISFIKTKVNASNKITDAATLASVIRVIHSLKNKMNETLTLEYKLC